MWDVFAVSTYATVSLLFWFVGLMPDWPPCATAPHNRLARFVYGILAMGWRGSARHWAVYETASLLLAGLATPLVLSVHTVVSFDFTIAIVPGWHSTFFPPYFVAGAIYSGFAMVLALAIPLRAVYGLEGLITDRHLDNSAKIMLATGLIVAYAYMTGDLHSPGTAAMSMRMAAIWNRMTGPYAVHLLDPDHAATSSPPSSCGSRRSARTRSCCSSGSLDRAGRHVAGALRHHCHQPGAGLSALFLAEFQATRWDWATYFGTIGLFLFLFFLFIRLLPMISIFEVRTLLPQARSKRR